MKPEDVPVELVAKAIKSVALAPDDGVPIETYMRTILAAVIPLVSTPAWRTMDSAPRDRFIMGLCGDEPIQLLWSPIEPRISDEYPGAFADRDGRIWEPRRWQPLPEPPVDDHG